MDSQRTKMKRRTLLCITVFILFLIIATLVFEIQKIKDNVSQVTFMRTKVMRDYLVRIGNQADALGLSVADYLDNHEKSPVHSRFPNTFKNYPELNIFSISNVSKKGNESLRVGSLTGEGSTSRIDFSLKKEMEAALNLDGQLQALTGRRSEVAWAYYTSVRKFIYLAPKASFQEFYFTDDLYAKPFRNQFFGKRNSLALRR
nr:hypothetical protein [Leptospira yasudae]